jgi:hypothetical protein
MNFSQDTSPKLALDTCFFVNVQHNDAEYRAALILIEQTYLNVPNDSELIVFTEIHVAVLWLRTLVSVPTFSFSAFG